MEKDYEWERYLSLVLYAYCTAVHTSTGVSLFVLMFGRERRSNDLSPHIAFDTNSYQGYLQAASRTYRTLWKLLQYRLELLRKTAHAKLLLFKEGDSVWL